MTVSIILRVRNVQCEGCAIQVKRALEALPGVEEVHGVDVVDGAVELDLDEDRTSRDELEEVLDEAGFPVGGFGRAEPSMSGAARFGVLAFGTLVVGLLGYGTYELYPRFDMPAVDGLGLLALAIGAGVASFFSPCAFSLLLTIVGREASPADAAGSRDGPTAQEGGGFFRPFHFAAAMSLGATAFVLLLGAVMALGGRAIVGDVVFTSAEGRILRAGVGFFLIGLGLVQTGFLPSPLHAVEEAVRPLVRFQGEQRRERPFVGSTLFGFGYLLAGFG